MFQTNRKWIILKRSSQKHHKAMIDTLWCCILLRLVIFNVLLFLKVRFVRIEENTHNIHCAMIVGCVSAVSLNPIKGSRCFVDENICRHCSVLYFGCNNEFERYFNNRTRPHKYKLTPRVLWQRSSYVILVLSLN